jgi:hypothetical protein
MASKSFESVYYEDGHSGYAKDEISAFEFEFKNPDYARASGGKEREKRPPGSAFPAALTRRSEA